MATAKLENIMGALASIFKKVSLWYWGLLALNQAPFQSKPILKARLKGLNHFKVSQLNRVIEIAYRYMENSNIHLHNQ